YRVLDSEMLGRLIDVGIIGLLALVVMIACIITAAAPAIRARHPVWSPYALAVAGAAAAYFVLCFLFDVSSFPHTPYILMSMAGLLAVIVSEHVSVAETPRERALVRAAPPPAVIELAAPEPAHAELAARS